MKVLMLCNIIPNAMAEELELSRETGGGWASSVISAFESRDDLELCVCFPNIRAPRKIEIQISDTMYYGFKKEILNPTKYDAAVEKQFKTIIAKEHPDIVHIFGTEFPHTLAMVRAFNKPERTVIHIQGLVSVCAQHYCAYLPYVVTKKRTFRDLLRQDNISQQKKKFELRGEYEIEALKQVGHVMGRTDWDHACCRIIHPDIKYHYVQEMMRLEFYQGQWNYIDCEKHSIFMSQGSYPIKGLHLALEALHILKVQYPDIKLYVAGTDIVHNNGIEKKIRQSYYSKYITALINKWNLEAHIVFLGLLNAKKMKEQFLSSHVFISPSVIENSPNSIGEAMLLGVPIVASDAGGVSCLIKHKENGFLYQADAPYMLAYYIGEIFDKREMAEELSQNEVSVAASLYARETVIEQVIDVYEEMSDGYN